VAIALRKIAKANRGFKGIWIPASSWLDENLSIQEMLFLAEIDSLDTNEQGCFASNKHFSDFFGLSKSRSSEIINSLANKNYINIKYSVEGKEVKKRVIKVFGKSKRGIRNPEEGYSENTTGSNTSFSNTNINKDNMSGKPSIPYSEIIDYLNKQTGKSFKSSTQNSKKLIKARWNEGYRLEDFKKVIDNKVADWTGKTFDDGSPAENYLQPSTLFAGKFETYLNQVLKRTNQGTETASNNPVVF
jgi:uncharacterized phage protein (TIGR02220 family)